MRSDVFRVLRTLGMAGVVLLGSCGPEHHRFRDLQQRAQAGEAEAQYHLALLYAGDPERLYRWLSDATDPVTPPPPGEEIVWVMPDDRTALTLFLQAAQQGHAEARYRVARMYLEGRGTETDPFEAYLWFSRLAQNTRGVERERALHGRAEAGGRITDYQRDEARRILRETLQSLPSVHGSRRP